MHCAARACRGGRKSEDECQGRREQEKQDLGDACSGALWVRRARARPRRLRRAAVEEAAFCIVLYRVLSVRASND